MSFATPEELAVWTATEVEEQRYQLLLDLATGLIKDWAGQTIERATSTAALRGDWSARLVLPERPAVSVESVTVAGVELAEDVDWRFDGIDSLWRGPRTEHLDGPDLVPGGHWGGPSNTVLVEYVHGFDPVPDSVRGINLAAAARALANPDGVTSESVDGYSQTFAREKGVVLTGDELEALRWLRSP